MSGPSLFSDLLARVSEIGAALAPAGRRATALDRCRALMKGRGEATGLAIARDALDLYARLDADGRRAFFEGLRTEFGGDPARIGEATARWLEARDDAAARALHVAAEPRSQELIRRLNRAPGGTAALVAMRADLLGLLREAPELAPLDSDFRHLFASWFNRGFLRLERIDWSTSAEVLERIIRYEAVHEIAGWDDLRRRVAARDRRLYAFFHPALPGEPLIFVEVALSEEIPDAIGPVLAEAREETDPREATTAVFYSISNCQRGLAGISFGAFLIKQVVEELQREAPGLRQFVTLSPVPGLRAWAEATGMTPAERAATEAVDAGGEGDPAVLAGLAARCLLEGVSPRGGPPDPVARFHLGNGARLERIDPGADLSERGRRASWGVMVNYLYALDRIERNHEAFVNEGTVAASSAVQRLVRKRRGEGRVDA